MALVTVDAVIDVASHALVISVRVGFRVAIGALEHGVVIRIRMARGANTVGVAMVDRKSCVLRVIERRTSPGSRVMAGRASGREELRLRRVARIGCVVVVGLMTTDTRGGQRHVVAVDMAVGAYPRRCLVRAGQGKGRVVVIERGVCPDGGVVAEFACSRESGRSVRGIVGAGVVLLVARVAQGTVQRIIIVDMAVRALPWRNSVTSRQRETGAAVIERRVCPRTRVVALIACLREAGGNVIGVCSPLIVLQMTRHTGGARQIVVIADMAIGTLPRWHGVQSGERETCAVVIEDRICP